MDYASLIDSIRESGNMREIPADFASDPSIKADFSSNDYLGLAADPELTRCFFASRDPAAFAMSASASRLLAARQDANEHLEHTLSALFPGREILLFNSGYHVNTGLIAALADRDTLIIADRLVHASIIDGILLSRAEFKRFRHNDIDHLESILEKECGRHSGIMVVVESVYSMDGDSPDIEALIRLKNRFPEILLYIDEAHAFGVCGPGGAGLVASSSQPDSFDVVVATFGKALASVGAFAAMSGLLRMIAVNKARSFIFSTMLPPINVEWTAFLVGQLAGFENRRARLRELSVALAEGLREFEGEPRPVSHIQPYIVGSAAKAMSLSASLREAGDIVLPIRKPTVPAGTERLRISLSAALSVDDVKRLCNEIKELT